MEHVKHIGYRYISDYHKTKWPAIIICAAAFGLEGELWIYFSTCKMVLWLCSLSFYASVGGNIGSIP